MTPPRCCGCGSAAALCLLLLCVCRENSPSLSLTDPGQPALLLPFPQLRGIDKKIAALKAEVNYASSGDRQRYLSGLSSLEEEKSRLANGILSGSGPHETCGGGDDTNGAGDSGQDMEDDGGSTPPPSARRRHAVVSDHGSDDESVEEEYSHAPSSRSRRHSDMDTAPSSGVSSSVITEKELRQHFHLPLHTAAQKFGICTTAFKKLCR
jgi:hypothetical protein